MREGVHAELRGRVWIAALALGIIFGAPSPAPAQTAPACLAAGADIVLAGTHTTDYYTRSLAPGTAIDARAATFVHCSQPDPTAPCALNVYPVNLGPVDGENGCWAGGVVTGENRLDASWTAMHDPNNAGFIFENRHFTVDGLRMHNVGDGIRPRGGAADFVIRNVWLSYVRDDCVENDNMNTGLVDDSLFDGCFVGFSARHSDTSVEGPDNVWTIQNSLVRLEPMPGPPEGGEIGHKGFFKWVSWGDPNSRSPKLALYNNVFMAEMQGQIDAERMGIPPGKLVDCANNVMVWLGPGAYPASLPDCFTVTTDRRVWDGAVTAWIRRHTQPCASDADCDDGNPCTIDACDQGNGQCRHDDAIDGTSCGADALCCAGACGLPACVVDADCDDGNPCAIETCSGGGTCAATCRTESLADGAPCEAGICCAGGCRTPACSADADCGGTDTCRIDRCVAPGTCAATCTASTPACGPDDGCCGPACTHATDADCPATVCGNGACEGGAEDCRSCPLDCRCQGKDCTHACCGDGVCTGNEKARSCPVDCR